MDTTVLLGTQKSDQSAWRMASNQHFLSSLDREKPYERRVKDKPCLDWKSEEHNSDRWTTFQSRRKTKAQMRNTHNAADSRLRCPEPRSRAIIVQMVYWYQQTNSRTISAWRHWYRDAKANDMETANFGQHWKWECITNGCLCSIFSHPLCCHDNSGSYLSPSPLSWQQWVISLTLSAVMTTVGHISHPLRCHDNSGSYLSPSLLSWQPWVMAEFWERLTSGWFRLILSRPLHRPVNIW